MKRERNRKLAFETFESRHLLSADVWPQGIGVAADLFVDGGASLSSVSMKREAALLDWTRETLLTSSASKTRAVIGGNSNDSNGALLFPDGQARLPVIYVNGGKATSHQNALGAAGRAAIRAFVSAGGSFAGSCAGAWVAMNQKLYPGSASNRGGSGTQTVTFQDDGNPVSEFLKEHNTPLVVTGVPHYGGPAFHKQVAGADYYGKVTSTNVSHTRNSLFTVAYQPLNEDGTPVDGRGGVVISGSHPEYGRKQSHTVLMAAMLNLAADMAQVTPHVKGELPLGQTLQMVGATEKVGDSQYHRYIIDVPEGLEELRLSSSAPLTTEMYVGMGDMAHELDAQYSGDEIVIVNPTSGQWAVSVKGTHNVLNGVAYELAIDADTGPNLPSPWQNSTLQWDVNDDGIISPLDVAWLINDIHLHGPRDLTVTNAPQNYPDVNGDRRLDLSDAIAVLDYLIAQDQDELELRTFGGAATDELETILRVIA